MDGIGRYEELFVECAETYRFLSQALYKELTVQAIDQLAAMTWPEDAGNANLDEGYACIRRYFAFGVPDRRQQLAVEYARIFLAAGVFTRETNTAIPYESVFTSEDRTMMGDARDDAVQRFREDGFAVDPLLHEPEDHLSFELEYLQMMCERAAVAAVGGDAGALAENARRQASFIDAHLLNWLPLLRKAVDEYATLTFYPGLLLVAQGTLEQERLALGDIIACDEQAAS